MKSKKKFDKHLVLGKKYFDQQKYNAASKEFKHLANNITDLQKEDLDKVVSTFIKTPDIIR